MVEEINRMFSKIYKNYDLMNHLFSFNFDKLWREEAAGDALIDKESYTVLDVAAGTGDLAIAVSKRASEHGKKIDVYAYDFNKDMLAVGNEKFKKEGIGNIKNEIGDAFHISHKSNSVDVVTSGFGLRSFLNSKDERHGLEKFVSESYRVLRPKGKAVLLDMAMPDDPFQRTFFNGYSYFMLAAGSLVDHDTYAWLVRTIKEFDKKNLLDMMRRSGFRNVKIRSLRSGIAFIATGEK